MRIEVGAKFCLNLDDAMRAKLNRAGWAGCVRGTVEKIDERRVAVRFADGQPWQFLRRDFESAVGLDDDGPMEEVWD